MGKKIVCIGDSITQGYNICTDKSWPAILGKNYDVINKGISGDTTAGMLARFIRDVVDEAPSHIIIMGGTNDLYFDIPMSLILSHIVAMTRQARYHDIKIIIGMPPLSYNKNKSFELYLDGDIHGQKIIEYREKLKTLSAFEMHSYIDFNEGLSASHFLEDGLHPSEQGHSIMAENAKKVLDQVTQN